MRLRGRRKRRSFFIVTVRWWVVLGAIFALASTLILLRRSWVSPAGSFGPLQGQIIYIDPGHGGIDPGACGQKYQEKDIVLKVALFLGVKLEKSGAKVVYTRTGDYDLETPEVDDVSARIRLMKTSGATLVISLHCNAFTSSYERGAQTFYNASKNPQSKTLATLIQNELIKETGTEREVSSRLDHFILNHAEVPAVTVELGFLSNPSEEELLGSSAYQEKLATCIYKAVLQFVSGKNK